VNEIAAYKNIEALSDQDIIVNYTGLVKKIAYHLHGRLPNSVQIEDLIQAGMIGLLSAAGNYNAEKGANFDTYASIRIRGMMLDEVRKNDWVPRSVYKNSRRISEAIRSIENNVGRDARDQEIADKLEISVDDYHSMLKDVSTSQVYGLDDVGLDNDSLHNQIGIDITEPMEGLAYQDFVNNLAECIDALPEKEKLVLSLYYDEELNLKEIGEVLGVSESRICQIHSQAMMRLRSRLPEWNKS